MRYRNLRDELDVIAREELADVLEAWPDWTPEQAQRLAAYLRDELDGYGMLSVAKGRDSGVALGPARAEARRILARLERQA
jgi:hypothetical protein